MDAARDFRGTISGFVVDATTYTDARFGMLPAGHQNFPRLIQVSGKISF
jgi:hypothetical protein